MPRSFPFRSISTAASAAAAALLLGACATSEPQIQTVSAPPLQPRAGERVVVDHVLIVVDSSGSLEEGARFYHARALAESIVASSPEGDYEAGAVAFGGFDRDAVPMARFDRSALRSGTARLAYLESGTPIHKVLDEAKADFASRKGRAAVVIISDGEFTDEFGREVAVERILASATELDASYDGTVCFHTVQVGESRVGAELLRRVSQVTSCGSTRAQAAIAGEAELHALQRDVFIGAAPVAARRPLPPVSAPAPVAAPAPAPTRWSVNFGYDSAAVGARYRGTVREIAERAEASPQARIEISGHTDSKGDPEYNRRLSMRRAQATRKALVDAGVDSRRIDIKSFGEDSLLMPDDSEANAAQNRRTEIQLVE